MIVGGKSTGKKIDLRDECGELKLKPETQEEAKFLAFLYLVTRLGGTIELTRGEKQATFTITEA